MPFTDTINIRNPYNDNHPVQKSRDGQVGNQKNKKIKKNQEKQAKQPKSKKKKKKKKGIARRHWRKVIGHF